MDEKESLEHQNQFLAGMVDALLEQNEKLNKMLAEKVTAQDLHIYLNQLTASGIEARSDNVVLKRKLVEYDK